MHDFIYFIRVIVPVIKAAVPLIGALSAYLAVSHKSRKDNYNGIIKELKNERDTWKQYYHDEHQLHLKDERTIEELKNKINKEEKH